LAERPCDFEHGRVTQICSPADRDSQHFNEATSGANLTIAIKLLAVAVAVAVAMDAKRSITRVLVFKFSGHKPEQLTSDGRLGIVGRRKTENGKRKTKNGRTAASTRQQTVFCPFWPVTSLRQACGGLRPVLHLGHRDG